jgi:MFS family permease
LENLLYKKITWRILPIVMTGYILSYLDRVNVGFAKLQMLDDLKFSETVYGLGAAIFFIGYFLFEMPSNIIMHKVGARRWLARIMFTWAILSGACMFINSPTTFYVLRFFLGVAEAGFFPGIILYLTYWYPSDRQAGVVGLFMSAIALSGIIGGPVSGAIMQHMAGINGWAGWQWMFLLEALSLICFWTSGVRTQPGQIALTVTLVEAVSRATAFVKPTRPCFAAT